MTRRACDGPGILAAFRAAVANVEAHVEEINALNVFPVPDGDTGTNMVATLRAALEEAEAAESREAGRVIAALSFGSLMGARGNSGVIASQIIRGAAEALAGKNRFNALDLAHAMRAGAEAAYAAVTRPVEGTILTVARDAAAAAVAAAEATNDIEAVLVAATEAAQESVRRTPSLLPILREAGVVDSGGQGLYRLLQGLLRAVVATTAPEPETGPPGRAVPRASAVVAHADEGFGYETMFLVQAPPGRSLDLDAIRAHLETIGESVLVAGDARAAKIHVHNERPDAVLAYGLSLGTLSRISIENLDQQTRDVRERRAAEFAGAAAVTPGGPAPTTLSEPPPASIRDRPTDATDTEPLPLGVVAVAAGPGLASVFESFGVNAIVDARAGNPSTSELKAAVDRVPAREVILLPNDPDVLLAAEQVARLADRPVRIVPTRNAAEGVAALLALDPATDAAANVEPMTKAARSIQSFAVTQAVRDAKLDGRRIHAGETIALGPDDCLLAVDRDLEGAVEAALAALRPGFELVTLYYGDGADLDEAERLARRLGELRPGIEVEVVHGGQPHYRYLVAVE
ncbi:MAG: hypothetical protein KatS3mg065_0526 [Chloroflexota bacterium]|nr:MAG: hypothetical protein KatS3mg065_0526 [Chloroflexota bacterium]